ncbi:MAG: BrnT family toxin, partial [Gemmatimonadetes bacterium]|nr:BrnT family toxin [Gemmatimonadota bacterium]
EETRYFCFGKVEDRILTVRFTYRKGNIRIFGAGYWREGRDRYEQKKKI